MLIRGWRSKWVVTTGLLGVLLLVLLACRVVNENFNPFVPEQIPHCGLGFHPSHFPPLSKAEAESEAGGSLQRITRTFPLALSVYGHRSIKSDGRLCSGLLYVHVPGRGYYSYAPFGGF